LDSQSPTPTAAKSSEESSMTDIVWIGIVTLFVFAYLLYALLVPEKF
jgi:K+-transporting ATPase KdpF subunit